MSKKLFSWIFFFLLVSCGGDSGGGSAVISESVGPSTPIEAPNPCDNLLPNEVCETLVFPEGSGIRREYILNIPATVTEPNPPLFIMLHGGGADGSSGVIPFQIRAFISKNKMIGVFPNAKLNKDGIRSWFFDDVPYIEEIIRLMELNQNIDPNRVFVFGFSNGAFMANLLACKIPEKITAMMSYAGTLLEPLHNCSNAGNIAIHNMHSTGDQVIPFAGFPGRFLGALESIEEWRIFNQCDATFTQSAIFDLTFDEEGDDAATRTYENCLRTVQFTQIEGAGHLPIFLIGKLHTLMINFYNQATNEISY